MCAISCGRGSAAAEQRHRTAGVSPAAAGDRRSGTSRVRKNRAGRTSRPPTWTSSLRSKSATFGTPSRPISRSISSRKMSSARLTPSLPAAATPYSAARPTNTASAPSISAFRMSVPRLNPPSTISAIRSADRSARLGQKVDRRYRPVELAAAVVRDRDRVGADLGGALDIAHRQQPLDDQLARPAVADARDRIPRQAAIHLRANPMRALAAARDAPWARIGSRSRNAADRASGRARPASADAAAESNRAVQDSCVGLDCSALRPFAVAVDLRIGRDDQRLASGPFARASIRFSRISGGPNT